MASTVNLLNVKWQTWRDGICYDKIVKNQNLPDTGVAWLTVCVCCPNDSSGGVSLISYVTRRGTRSKRELSEAKHNRKQKFHTIVKWRKIFKVHLQLDMKLYNDHLFSFSLENGVKKISRVQVKKENVMFSINFAFEVIAMKNWIGALELEPHH